jgi:hypothetical protein
MSKINDGGPAFPVPDSTMPNGQVQFGTLGMSLREYLVSHVDVPWPWVEKVCVALGKTDPSIEEAAKIMAKLRVIQADEIIAELEKEKP